MNFNFVFNRARNLIINAKAEWNIIQSEALTKETIVKSYAIPLILLMAVCSLLGSLVMGSGLWFAIIKALGVFGFSYFGMHVSTIIIHELTSSFNSKKDLNTTFKLVVYSFTAQFIVSAIVYLWPPMSMLNVFGLFSIYLFWEGSSILLETPEDNKVGFVVVSALVIVGVFAILYLILAGILTTISTLKFLA